VSLLLRDQFIKQCWVPADVRNPHPDPRGPHYPVTCWAVIHDPRLKLEGDAVFQDVACYWPALDKWTITSQCRADEDAIDVEVNVAWWQPLPPMPW